MFVWWTIRRPMYGGSSKPDRRVPGALQGVLRPGLPASGSALQTLQRGQEIIDPPQPAFGEPLDSHDLAAAGITLDKDALLFSGQHLLLEIATGESRGAVQLADHAAASKIQAGGLNGIHIVGVQQLPQFCFREPRVGGQSVCEGLYLWRRTASAGDARRLDHIAVNGAVVRDKAAGPDGDFGLQLAKGTGGGVFGGVQPVTAGQRRGSRATKAPARQNNQDRNPAR